MNLKKYQKMFSILKSKNIYFDNSAATLRPKTVNKAVFNYDEQLSANAGRSFYNLGHIVTEKVEETRNSIASLIGANSNEIVFTKNTTESLNLIAHNLMQNLKKGDEVIISELEHNSNILPWLEFAKQKGVTVKTVPLDKNNKITLSNFKTVFNENTKIVSLTLLSNTLGYITPIREIARYAKKSGAIIVCDAAQAISHFEVNVKKLNVDFLVFSGYKMFGPTGVGIMFGKESLLKSFSHFNYGGGTVLEVYNDSFDNVKIDSSENKVFKLNQDKLFVSYKYPPHNLEGGTLPIASIIGLNEAVKLIQEITYEEISKRDTYLKNYLIDELKKVKGVEIYSKNPNVPIVSFNLKDIHPHDAATIYSDYGICLRAGHQCANLVAIKLNVNSSLRVSLAFYNTVKEIDKFIAVTNKIIKFFENK